MNYRTAQEVEDQGNDVLDIWPDGVFELTTVPVGAYAAYEIEDFIEEDEQRPYMEAMVEGCRNGSVPPVVLDDRGNVLDGGHRLAAAKRAGLQTISAFVMVTCV